MVCDGDLMLVCPLYAAVWYHRWIFICHPNWPYTFIYPYSFSFSQILQSLMFSLPFISTCLSQYGFFMRFPIIYLLFFEDTPIRYLSARKNVIIGYFYFSSSMQWSLHLLIPSKVCLFLKMFPSFRSKSRTPMALQQLDLLLWLYSRSADLVLWL